MFLPWVCENFLKSPLLQMTSSNSHWPHKQRMPVSTPITSKGNPTAQGRAGEHEDPSSRAPGFCALAGAAPCRFLQKWLGPRTGLDRLRFTPRAWDRCPTSLPTQGHLRAEQNQGSLSKKEEGEVWLWGRSLRGNRYFPPTCSPAPDFIHLTPSRRTPAAVYI